jgi:hypothetical protein
MNTQPASTRPQVLINTDEFRVVDEAIAALSYDPSIFQRGNVLVRVLRDEQPDDGISRTDGSATISRVPIASLRERLTRHAEFVRYNRKGEKIHAHPPQWLQAAVDARGEWSNIRKLRGISDSPILRADGSIWQTPGYDDQTGVLYDPVAGSEFTPIPCDVNVDDAEAALVRLLHVVKDFRFEGDEHRAAWIAGLLTPLARFAFAGPTPVFLVDANVRGAGKGLLIQIIGRIVLGRDTPVSSYSHDSQETRKKMLAIAIAGDRMICFDNVDGKFGNDALDRALTCTVWKDRILGRSEEIELPLLPSWFATGNNVQVEADTLRRTIHIRLDVLEERPEQRDDFTHKDLPSWVSANRHSLLRDALTILSAYIHAGKPKNGLRPFGSFVGWSNIVREAIVWVGLPDPCLTQAGLAEAADTSELVLSQLLSAWKDFNGTKPVTVRQMVAELYPEDRRYQPNHPAAIAMRAALEALAEVAPGRAPEARVVGNKLGAYRRRVVDGLFLSPQADAPAGETDTPKTKRSKHGVVWKLHLKSAGNLKMPSIGVSGDLGIHQYNHN